MNENELACLRMRALEAAERSVAIPYTSSGAGYTSQHKDRNEILDRAERFIRFALNETTETDRSLIAKLKATLCDGK